MPTWLGILIYGDKVIDIKSESVISACASKELNHLGLVAAMFDELGIGDAVDAAITQDLDQRKVSVGQALQAMVINGLGFANQRLYLVPQFFEGKPVESLIGAGVKSAYLNDDTLGRALDSIFDADPTVLYGITASTAMQRLALTGLCGHMDRIPRPFTQMVAMRHDEEPGVIRITRGYSCDHRPELNQFGLQLIVDGEAGIPMVMAAVSGNQSDKALFRESISTHVKQLQQKKGPGFLAADSELYTARTKA